MSDNAVATPDKISLTDFRLVHGQIDTPEDFDSDEVIGYHLCNSLRISFNLEDKLVKADFTIEIKTESQGKNEAEAKGSFHLVYTFHVEHLEELAKPDKHNQIELHPALGSALSSITYSTSRGILLTRLQGTALQRFILPVTDPNKLLHQKQAS